MTPVVKRKPVYAGKLRNEYPVIGHYDTYALIGSTTGDILFIDDKDEILEEGEYVEDLLLKPITMLPESDYNAIMDMLSGCAV